MLENRHDKIMRLCAAFGWERIKDPNGWTISFRHPEKEQSRINWYFTKRTFQMQIGWKQIVEKECSYNEIEQILQANS